MKNRLSLRLAGGVCAVVALAAWVVAGCSTTKQVDWNSRVGNYTLDQAVAEMGPPDKQTKLSDGSTVADWITHRSGGSGLSIGLGGGSYGGSGGAGVGVSQTVGSGATVRVTRLTFAPDGKLASWSK